VAYESLHHTGTTTSYIPQVSIQGLLDQIKSDPITKAQFTDEVYRRRGPLFAIALYVLGGHDFG
jgi:hypothetical protein